MFAANDVTGCSQYFLQWRRNTLYRFRAFSLKRSGTHSSYRAKLIVAELLSVAALLWQHLATFSQVRVS